MCAYLLKGDIYKLIVRVRAGGGWSYSHRATRVRCGISATISFCTLPHTMYAAYALRMTHVTRRVRVQPHVDKHTSRNKRGVFFSSTSRSHKRFSLCIAHCYIIIDFSYSPRFFFFFFTTISRIIVL